MIYFTTIIFLFSALLFSEARGGENPAVEQLPGDPTNKQAPLEQSPIDQTSVEQPPAVMQVGDTFEQQAYLLYNRIAGVPPDREVLDLARGLLEKNKKGEAALLATKDPAFYNIKLRNMFGAWSNVSSDVSSDLNDMVATMIGMVRDDVPFNQVLSADLLYVATESAMPELTEIANNRPESDREKNKKNWRNQQDDGPPSYSLSDNELFSLLQESDLQKNLKKVTQSEMPEALPDKAIAGVLSTRGFGEAFYSAGTNRRATAFVLKNFLCHEIEELHDVNAGDGSLGADQFVRQDVDRTPGGDGGLFRSRCLGCHAGMDAMSGWSVYYDYRAPDDRSAPRLMYNDRAVQEKVGRNKYLEDPKFIAAHTPKNDSFTNIWVKGPNARLGWGDNISGNGAAEWGQMITASKAFARCMVTHAYNAVCFNPPDSESEQDVVSEIADLFIADNYKMRNMIAATAVSCLAPNKQQTPSTEELPAAQQGGPK